MTPLIGHKCFGCKFCLYYKDWHKYACDIKGCWEYSKFVEYKFIVEDKENK